MSEEQRAECRAFGALDSLLETMAFNMEREGRSKEYIEAFWDNLRNVCSDFANFGYLEAN